MCSMTADATLQCNRWGTAGYISLHCSNKSREWGPWAARQFESSNAAWQSGGHICESRRWTHSPTLGQCFGCIYQQSMNTLRLTVQLRGIDWSMSWLTQAILRFAHSTIKLHNVAFVSFRVWLCFTLDCPSSQLVFLTVNSACLTIPSLGNI